MHCMGGGLEYLGCRRYHHHHQNNPEFHHYQGRMATWTGQFYHHYHHLHHIDWRPSHHYLHRSLHHCRDPLGFDRLDTDYQREYLSTGGWYWGQDIYRLRRWLDQVPGLQVLQYLVGLRGCHHCHHPSHPHQECHHYHGLVGQSHSIHQTFPASHRYHHYHHLNHLDRWFRHYRDLPYLIPQA